MTGRRLVLLRHGRTAWNESGRAQGHADVGLDGTGHAQAAAAAPYLASLAPVALWCSDLARARQTCAYLVHETGLDPKYDERLREFDVGDRQGLTGEEFAARFPGVQAAWLRGDDAGGIDGAESTADVEARMLPALRECLGSLAAGETGLVVTHGAALRVGMVGLLGWPAHLAAGLRGMDNCAWATLEEVEPAGPLRLVSYNESVRTERDPASARSPGGA